VAGDPGGFGSCGRRQRLVTLGRAARYRDRSSPATCHPGSVFCSVLPSPCDSPPQFPLSWKDSALAAASAATTAPGRLRSIVPTFQEVERFVVTAAVEVMCQARIDWLRKRCLQFIDFLRDDA